MQDKGGEKGLQDKNGVKEVLKNDNENDLATLVKINERESPDEKGIQEKSDGKDKQVKIGDTETHHMSEEDTMPGQKADGYVLGRDYMATARLNYQHFLWKEQLGFLVHPSIQVARPDVKVADIGTGTGYVCFDFITLDQSAPC